MKQRLLWKLLLVNSIPVIGVIVLVIWLAIDKFAAAYFMSLMDIYEVAPDEIHRMFLTSIHKSLIWASIAALGLSFVLSYLLTRRVLRPLLQMTAASGNVAAGDYSDRVEVTTNDEVGQLGRAFNRMADSLEGIERLRKTMVADVAHELRTPLTNLRGYLEALSDGVIPPTEQTLRMLQQENLRLVHLVDSLQQLARAEAAKTYLRRERVDLADLVEQVTALHALHFSEKMIAVQTRISEGDLTVSGDRDKLLQALSNLAENCWRYAPVEGVVTITVSRQDDGITVDFCNSGPGIDAADLPFIFERFFRTDRSRSREAGGAGIGLAITRELITAHGGQVGAASSPDKTHVWFVLPA